MVKDVVVDGTDGPVTVEGWASQASHDDILEMLSSRGDVVPRDLGGNGGQGSFFFILIKTVGRRFFFLIKKKETFDLKKITKNSSPGFFEQVFNFFVFSSN